MTPPVTPVKILVLDGCEPCAEVKELSKGLIDAGEVRLVDGMSDEGQKLLHEHREIDHVPYAFVEGETGQLRKCSILLHEDGIEFNCD